MPIANENTTSIFEQAAHWWVVLRDGDASAAEKREFVGWVTRAPDRVEACLHLARLQSALARADVRWPATSAAELVRDALAESEVIPLHAPARRTRERAHPRMALRLALGLAASLLLTVCLVTWFTWSRPEHFQTKVGEQRSVLLADGSRVTLNTSSKIEVRLQAAHRTVALVQGEALFEVAHDASRPFDVHVGNVVVRAVGTQFDIERRAARTAITVVEGRVAMLAGQGRAEHLPVLAAGDRVFVDEAGAGEVEHDVELADATAWTRRKLVFRHRPLGEVADELNRYNVTRIEVRSPSLRAQELTGTFGSDDVASFIAVLEGIPGVHVSNDAAGGYVVTSDEPAVSQP